MNSRMNFGSGFSIPQENDKQNRGHQLPLTPEKPIASRSSSIPVERQGNQIGGNQLGMENWKELIGFYFGVLQENRGHQMPLTPEKPIASRSSSIPIERQGNQIGGNQLGMENWKELIGFYFGVLQENWGHQMPLTPEKPIASRSSSIPVERQGNQIGGNQLGMENWKDLIGFYSRFIQENRGHQMPLTPEESIASRSRSIPVERQGNQIRGNQLGMENWKDLLGFYSWFIQENRGHQMPLTLEKPIASRSSSIPVKRQGNQIGVNKLGMENWKDLIGFYSDVLQETTDCLNFNPIGFNSCTGGSYSSDFNPSVAWNNCTFAEVTRIKKALSMVSANSMPSKRIRVMSTQSIPNLHSQACSNWAYSNHQNCPPNSNSWINGESMSYMPKNGFQVPYRTNNNLNSPPRSEADSNSNVTTSFSFFTPDQAKQLEKAPLFRKTSFVYR